MEFPIALIADGRLVLVGLDGRSKRHDCEFAADIERRSQQSADKNSWLRGDDGAQGSMFESSQVWGKRAVSAPSIRPRIIAVTGGERPESMVYALWTGVVGALLDYDFGDNYERRVFHRERFHASEFDRHPATGRLVCRYGEDAASSLAVLDPDGRNLRPVTEGDSIDASPSWIPGDGEGVVYHSAGISRDPRGIVHGVGAFSIHRMNLRTGSLETVMENPATDLLSPQYDAAGNLYFIRRPYEGPSGARVSPWVHLKDVLLFPFRMIRTLVDLFQIVSMLVSKKPLATIGGPKAQGPEPIRMWIHGRMIDVKKAEAANAPDGALAPADWELVKRTPAGVETVLSRHVLAYNLSSDGNIILSDGRNLHLLENGKKKKIHSEPLIDSIKWLEPYQGEPA